MAAATFHVCLCFQAPITVVLPPCTVLMLNGYNGWCLACIPTQHCLLVASWSYVEVLGQDAHHYTITILHLLSAYMNCCCAGMVANGGLLDIHEGLGGLSLNTNTLAASGINDQLAQHIGSLTSKHLTNEQLTRSNGFTSVGTNASSTTSTNTVASSAPFSQGISHGNGLPFGWVSMADPEGRVFYFNSLTGLAQWNSPLVQ